MAGFRIRVRTPVRTGPRTITVSVLEVRFGDVLTLKNNLP